MNLFGFSFLLPAFYVAYVIVFVRIIADTPNKQTKKQWNKKNDAVAE